MLLAFLALALNNDADGKKVVNSLKAALLLFHLLPDGVNALRAALHVELQTGFRQLFLNRLDEFLDVGVAALLRGIEFLLDHVVGIMLQILQRQVLQLALQLVETQLVGEWGIEIACLLTHLHLGRHVLRVTNLPHQVHTVGNHDENHAHVLRKGKQQVAEILALNDGILLVEVLNADQTVDDGRNLLAEVPFHLFQRQQAVNHARMEQDGQHAVALQAFLLHSQHRRLHALVQRVESEHVTLNLPVLEQLSHTGMHLCLVTFMQGGGNLVSQQVEQFQRLRFFLFGENQSFFHSNCKSTQYFGKKELFAEIFYLAVKQSAFEREILKKF